MHVKFQIIGAGFWGEGDTPLAACRNAEKAKGSKFKKDERLSWRMFVSHLPFHPGPWEQIEDVPEEYAACCVGGDGSSYRLRCVSIPMSDQVSVSDLKYSVVQLEDMVTEIRV